MMMELMMYRLTHIVKIFFFSSGIIFSLLYISEDYSRNWHMFLSIESRKEKDMDSENQNEFT